MKTGIGSKKNLMRIFISHSYSDFDIANQLTELLVEQGNEIVLFDNDAFVNSKVQLKNNIKKLLNETDVLILLYTENSINSNWVNYEFNVFAEYSKQNNYRKAIFPVVIGDIEVPKSIANRYVFIKAERNEIEQVAIKLNNSLSRFQGELIAKEEQEKKVKERIEKSSADYVEETLSRLETRESELKRKANLWYNIGYGSIVGGIIVAILFTILTSTIKIGDWLDIGFLGLKSAIIIVLLITSSKYSLTLAKTYMNESLKNSDRIHAISFGKFYLQVFGNSVDSKDVKDVFGDWNLDKQSEFIQMDSNDYDPKLVEIIIKTIKVLKGNNEE